MSEGFPTETRVGPLLCGLILACLIVPTSVFAQSSDGGDIDDQTKKEVLQLLREGKKAYGAENYEEAHDFFSKAYDKWPRTEILVRLGKTAEELGRTEDALSHYRAFLDDKPETDMKEKVEEKISDLEAKLPAAVRLTSKPEGAEVFADAEGEERIGKTPVDVEVEPGEQTWTFRLEEYEETSETIEVEAGEERTVTVELEQSEEKVADRSLEGSGSQLEGSGSQLDEKEESKEEDEPAVSPNKTTTASPLATLGWSTGIASVVGLGTGVLFSALQGQAVDRVDSYNRGTVGSSPSELDSLKETARGHHRVSLVGYAAGGALMAASLGMLGHHYILSDSGASEQAGLHLEPRVGIGDDGGWAGVRFDF